MSDSSSVAGGSVVAGGVVLRSGGVVESVLDARYAWQLCACASVRLSCQSKCLSARHTAHAQTHVAHSHFPSHVASISSMPARLAISLRFSPTVP